MVEPSAPPYVMADLAGGARLHAPAAERNVGAIGDVLAEWLPAAGTVLEIASGSGQHARAFATRFAALTWQPSDPDPLALESIEAWRGDAPENLLAPLWLDAASDEWPVECAEAILCVNMVHIAPWSSAEGLVRGAARRLQVGGRLILYGPWIVPGEPLAPSNAAFDQSLKARDPRWGLRDLSEFAALAASEGLVLAQRRAMPANNQMLRFDRV